MQTEKFNIGTEQDVYIIIRAVKHLAEEMGFNETIRARLATAVSEIVTNVIKHAGKGECVLGPTKNQLGLEIIISDQGPGIKDIDEALTKGYSTTKGSLGIGLAGAKRLVEDFQIKSSPDKGTTVIMREFPPINVKDLEHGMVSLPKLGEAFNGDGYFIKEISGDKLFVAVIDGGGHGQSAKEKTDLALGFLEKHYRDPLENIITECDKMLHQKEEEGGGREKGLVMGLCLLFEDKLSYLGVGDTEIMVIGPNNRVKPTSQPGVMGFFKLPRLKLQEYDLSGPAIIIMYSDGIMKRFGEKDLPLEQNARDIAGFIVQNYQREQDDATVLVVKKKK